LGIPKITHEYILVNTNLFIEKYDPGYASRIAETYVAEEDCFALKGGTAILYSAMIQL
jgi:hypothetical protein